jgi:Fe-S cluster assembly protein SufD
VLNPTESHIEVPSSVHANLLLLHTKSGGAEVSVRMEACSELNLVELFLVDDTSCRCTVHQQASSVCNVTSILLSASQYAYHTLLEGEHAECRLNGLFLLSEKQQSIFDVRVDHLVADCCSHSLVRGVASREAQGTFRGLVYVAKGAERTDAQQTSRNIELSQQARIITAPQLEIYADDVKCSHGATVGHMGSDAILYMRQRGLSEAQARRLQIEGFVGAVATSCPVDTLREILHERIVQKLEQM